MWPSNFLALLMACSVFSAPSKSYDWSAVSKTLTDAVKDKAFPGCVALVADKGGIWYHQAFGSFTYGAPTPQNGQNPSMTLDTRFDMASCTKVTMTTTAIAQFYQRNELQLDTPVTHFLGPDFAQNAKGDITVLNLLLHNSGFFPDPNPFWNKPEFGCPQTNHYNPLMNFDCSEKILQSILSQKLQHPIGKAYVYSDLNFITLMHIVGILARQTGAISSHHLRSDCRDLKGTGVENQCYFEAYVRTHVIEAAEMHDSGMGYLDKTLWGKCAPAENDTVFFHSTYQGQVSDGNAFALGGIAGHAGLFSNTHDLHKFMTKVMFAPEESHFMNKTTMKYFTKEYDPKFSSRALGWDINDPNVNDMGFNRSCGTLSPKTWMHTGFTGTLLCGDPDRELIVILLTNRVYPVDDNIKIRVVRQVFSEAVQVAYDKGQQNYFEKLKAYLAKSS